MKVHSTNYQNTFIEIAEDCPAQTGQIPPTKGDKKSVANYQYDMVSSHPYRYTSDEVFFHIFADRNDIIESEREAEREKFFSKGQPCFRASPLTKTYGWGVHSDEHGRIALYGAETEAYQRFLADGAVAKVKAMRSKKA